MPSSEPARATGWRVPLAVAGAIVLASLAIVAARTVWFDAYWTFRREPPWLAATGGANRLIDRQTRRAKVQQALTRDYETALVGSSTVYHGLDPADVDAAAAGRAFNAGISALSAEELPIVAAIVASRSGVRRVVVGLDYYMFARVGGPRPLDPALATPLGRLNDILGAAIGLYAVRDSRLDAVAGGDDPGRWTYDGFRVTPPLPPALTRQNDAVRRRTTSPYRPDRLAAIGTLLDRLRGRDVVLYLSPVSAAQRRVMADLGLLDDFARWRADLAALARGRGQRLLDLTELGAADPFDPATGSTATWIDNLHYTPVLGRAVLRAVGLRARAE